ncbi:hypothetical protein GGF39_003612 [Coemansia sp. RSA 1721]|nr:hypothetical protein GGF39_003612 [Coemansia sp. RSA 1721]
MEELIRVAKQHCEAKQDIDSKVLLELIEKANVDPDYESAADSALTTARDYLDDANDDQGTAEPVKMSPLDSRARTSKLISGRGAPGSTFAGTKLRQRQFGAMSDADMDALASKTQNEVLDNISIYATTRTRTTPTRPSISTDFDYLSTRRLSFSDPDANGFETPNVSRVSRRQRLNGGSGMSPPQDMYNSPQNISDPFEGSAISPHAPISPSRLSSMDESAAKAIQSLSRQKAKLQKDLEENKKRMEMNSEKHEREVAELQKRLDEATAELSQKRRDIEKYRIAEKSHLQTMAKTEESMSRLGIDLNSFQKQSSQLKHKLEKKTELLKEVERRVLDKEAHIHNLNAAADAHEQQMSSLKSQASELEFQIIDLRNEIEVARDYKQKSHALERENISLSETITALNAQIKDLRRQVNSAAANQANEAIYGDDKGLEAEGRVSSNRSLFEELETSGGYDLSGVDDVAYRKVATRNRGQSVPSSLASTSVSPTAGMGLIYDFEKRFMQEWVPYALKTFSPQDWFVLNEMWKRAERCDKGSDEQDQLRSELLSTLMSSTKVGFNEAIRSQNNPKLTRIAENVAAKYKGSSSNAETRALGGKESVSGSGVAKLLANGQHTTAVIILYSVVVFCLGIITASFFNIAQPMVATSSSSLPYGSTNSSMHAAKHSGDGGMDMVRQILVEDDTPIPKHYFSYHKRMPRSRIFEAMFYWMETLLWEDGDYQVPT